MKKIILLLSVIALGIILSSCKSEFLPEVYIRDLLDISDGTEELIYTPATIKIEVSSKSSFEEDKEKITAILQKYLGKISNVSFEESGFDNFYVAQIEVPIRSFSSNGLSENLFAFEVMKDENQNIVFAILFNNDLFEQMKKETYNTFYSTIEISDITIIIRLINDLREDIKITTQSVYLNDKPCPFKTSYILKRRRKANLLFSNVLRDYLQCSDRIKLVDITINE